MGETTVGKILLKNTVLPHLHEGVSHTFDKKGIADFFQNLSKSEPHNYKRIVSDLTRLGFETSTRLGSSVPLADLSPLDDKDERFDKLESDLAQIKSGPGAKKEKELKTLELYDTFTKQLDKALMDAGKKKNHTLSKVIVSGSRGSAQQYRNTAGAVVLVSDAKGKALTDFPIRNSFADGLTIPEYLLHSFGTRTGAIDTKLSVSDSGFLSKQLSRASMPIRVEMYDCGTDNGMPVKTTDTEQVGSYLARPIGGYKKNNEVTSAMLGDLRNKKIDELIIRSPITCTASRDHHFGAVCQLCVGRRERNRFPSIGEYVGLTASSPLGEALAQGTLNSKHSSSGANLGKTTATGFKLISQLTNIPKTFQDKAAISEVDGIVSKIHKLPQGGSEIIVTNNKKEKIKHYVPTGFNSKVREGEHVEEGDVLSEGLVNPSDIVKHKGIGAGRKYYADVLHTAFKESGMSVNHRNFQVLAKGAVDHVKITDPNGSGTHLPDSIVSYQTIEKDYRPRLDSKQMRPDLALGEYLESPILHFTIGTKITKAVVATLKAHRVDSITVNHKPPMFEPAMQRLLDVPGFVPDWAHQLYSTYLEKRLIGAVNEGMTSNLKGPSPILGLAFGVGFDDQHKTKAGEEEDVPEEITYDFEDCYHN